MDLTYGIIPPPDLKCLNNDIERQSESIGMWGIGRLLLYITDNIEALSMDLSASLNCIAKGNAATLAATIRNAGIAVRENKSLIPALQRMAGVAAIELGSLVPVGTGHRIGELAAAAARWTDLSDIAFANELIDERDNLRKLIKCLDNFVNDARAAAEPVFPIEDAIFERQAKAAERRKAGEEGPTEVAEQAAVVIGWSGEPADASKSGGPDVVTVAEAIDEHDAAILAFLNRNSNLRRKVSDVLPDKGPQDRKAIANRLRKLANRAPPLVYYPKGGRSGVAILPAGVDALKRATSTTPH